MTAIDPDTWPTQIAAIVGRIRTHMTSIGTFLDVQTVIDEHLTSRGHDQYQYAEGDARQAGASEDDRLLHLEAQFLAIEAFTLLERQGELVAIEGARPYHLRRLAAALGWAHHNWQPTLSETWRPTVRGMAIANGHATAVPVSHRWPAVTALIAEAARCYVRGLYMAAAVTARTAGEQAIRHGLVDLGCNIEDQPHGAARREQKLDELLPKRARFAPLDRSATLAALSAIRATGNTAAHEGQQPPSMLGELIHQLLPDATESLARACRTT